MCITIPPLYAFDYFITGKVNLAKNPIGNIMKNLPKYKIPNLKKFFFLL